jgi:hypothetical protein
MDILFRPDQPITPTLSDHATPRRRIVGGLYFDWTMTALNLLFLGGLYLDGWAHNHGKVDNSFFTVWHAFFYSGFALVALLLLGTMVVNRIQGAPRGLAWQGVLPRGYHLSVVGVLIFAAGGVGDLLWHELFGIEEDFEALLSPTHLLLGLGVGLVVTGPLRAAWQRPGHSPQWRAIAPALLSLSALISTLTFFMMFSHPIFSTTGGRLHYEFNNQVGQVAGVLGLLIVGAILVAPVLVVVRRWRLPLGSLTLVWGVNTVAMTMVGYQYRYTLWIAAAMILAALILDIGLVYLLPRLDAKIGFRLFAFLAPTLPFSAYYLVLLALEGTRWSVHLIAGSVALAGMVGWLLSYLVAPPVLSVPDDSNHL